MIADTYHDQSYAHYGADPAGPAWHKVGWQIDEDARVQDIRRLKISADSEKGKLALVDPTLSIGIGKIPTLVGATLLDPAEPGDQTVPLHSADAQLRSGKFKGIFRQIGYEHQASYADSAVLAATLYSLF